MYKPTHIGLSDSLQPFCHNTKQPTRPKYYHMLIRKSIKNSFIYKKRNHIAMVSRIESGGDILSRAVSSQVPSALKGLTSVFGMGTGDPFRHYHRKFLQLSLSFSSLFLPAPSQLKFAQYILRLSLSNALD